MKQPEKPRTYDEIAVQHPEFNHWEILKEMGDDILKEEGVMEKPKRQKMEWCSENHPNRTGLFKETG